MPLVYIQLGEHWSFLKKNLCFTSHFFLWCPGFELRTLHILCIVHINWVKLTRTTSHLVNVGVFFLAFFFQFINILYIFHFFWIYQYFIYYRSVNNIFHTRLKTTNFSYIIEVKIIYYQMSTRLKTAHKKKKLSHQLRVRSQAK